MHIPRPALTRREKTSKRADKQGRKIKLIYANATLRGAASVLDLSGRSVEAAIPRSTRSIKPFRRKTRSMGRKSALYVHLAELDERRPSQRIARAVKEIARPEAPGTDRLS